jgi:hypothetical protein
MSHFVVLDDLTIGWVRCECGLYAQIGGSGPHWGVTPPCGCGRNIAAMGDHQIDPSQTIVQSGTRWQGRGTEPPTDAGQTCYGRIDLDPKSGLIQDQIVVWVGPGTYVVVRFPQSKGVEAYLRYLLRHWWVWLLEGATQHYCEIESWFISTDWAACHAADIWDGPGLNGPRMCAELTSAMCNFILLDKRRSGYFQPARNGAMRLQPLSDVPSRPDGFNPTTYRRGLPGVLRLSLLAFECTEDYNRERVGKLVAASWWRPGWCQTYPRTNPGSLGGWAPGLGPSWTGWVDTWREYRTWHPGRVPNPRRVAHEVHIQMDKQLIRVFRPGKPTFDMKVDDKLDSSVWRNMRSAVVPYTTNLSDIGESGFTTVSGVMTYMP